MAHAAKTRPRQGTLPMTATTLALAVSLTLLAAGLYVAVGLRYRAKAHAEEHGLRAFSRFWLGLAAWGTLEAGWTLWVAIGEPHLVASITILHAKIIAAVLSFHGLVSYLVSLHTRDPSKLGLVTAAYTAIFLLVEAFYLWRAPVGQTLESWNAQLLYGRESASFYAAVVVALFLPPLCAAIAYALRARTARDAAQRRRILTVSAFFAVFFGGVLVGWLAAWPWWGFVERVLALATVAAVYMAIDPAAGGEARGEIAAI